MTLFERHYDAVVRMHAQNPDLPEREIAAMFGFCRNTVERILEHHYAGLRAQAEAARLAVLPASWKNTMRRELGSPLKSEWRRAA